MGLQIGVDRNNNQPYINIGGNGPKYISFKDNGDGTYTLIGK
jgi:hypothetical protein